MAGSVPEIPGIKAPPDGAREILREVAHVLQRKSVSFPGAQPVSLARRHLTGALLTEDFFVCEKSDGLRCLMYLGELEGSERVYLITRKNEVFWIPDLHIPLTRDKLHSFHRGTIIDGELVRNGNGSIRYLMFDMLVVNGELLVNKVLDKRLGYLRDNVYKPFVELCKQYPEDTSVFPFKIYMKPMELSYGLQKVLKEERGHLSDGLIFTSRNAPYVFGTDEKILKWKPNDENSVDFVTKLRFREFTDTNGESWLDYDSMPEISLLVNHGGSEYKEWGKLYLTDEEWENLKSLNEPLDDRVVECKLEDARWRIMRFRDDKHDANHISTVMSVSESIQDNITEEDLIAAVPDIREHWHKRDSARANHRQETKPELPQRKRLRSSGS